MSTATDERLLDDQTMEQLTLPIPKLDGHVADNLSLNFSGAVVLDRTMEDDLQMLEDLRLGQDVELTVTARVIGKGFSHAVKGESEDEVVGYQVKLKAHSVTKAE